MKMLAGCGPQRTLRSWDVQVDAAGQGSFKAFLQRLPRQSPKVAICFNSLHLRKILFL
jgi:hypothetical protein